MTYSKEHSTWSIPRNIETLRKPQWAKKWLLYYWLTLNFLHFREKDFVVKGVK